MGDFGEGPTWRPPSASEPGYPHGRADDPPEERVRYAADHLAREKLVETIVQQMFGGLIILVVVVTVCLLVLRWAGVI